MRLTIIHPCIGRKPGQPYIGTWQMEPLPAAVIAGVTPADVEVQFYDDRMEAIPFDAPADLVAIGGAARRVVHLQLGLPGPAEGDLPHHVVPGFAGAVPELREVRVLQHLAEPLPRPSIDVHVQRPVGGAVHPQHPAGRVRQDHAHAHPVERLADEAHGHAGFVESFRLHLGLTV